ncbi:MAG TPA: hypothetical protein VNU01_02395 [Egibacteraceae bacterium]|nr:hypothetical protein [Egibacteraceae bacterium]
MERELLHRLLSQAFLYDDPNAYRAGVQAAWGALETLRSAPPQRSDDPAPTQPRVAEAPVRATG